MASPEDTDDKHLTIHVVHAGFNRFSMQAILDHAKPGQPCDGRIVVRPSYGPPVRIALQNYSQVLGSVSYDDVLQNAEQVCADTECECVTRNPRYRGNARTLNHTITHNFGELSARCVHPSPPPAPVRRVQQRPPCASRPARAGRSTAPAPVPVA